MANRFAIAGTHNWSSTATWSTTTGGAGGASVPIAGDTADLNGHTVAMDINSITVATIKDGVGGGSLTVNLATAAKSITANITGAAVVITNGGSHSLTINGNVDATTRACLSISDATNVAAIINGNLLNGESGNAAFNDNGGDAAESVLTVNGTITGAGCVIAGLLVTTTNLSVASNGAAVQGTAGTTDLTVTGNINYDPTSGAVPFSGCSFNWAATTPTTNYIQLLLSGVYTKVFAQASGGGGGKTTLALAIF